MSFHKEYVAQNISNDEPIRILSRRMCHEIDTPFKCIDTLSNCTNDCLMPEEQKFKNQQMIMMKNILASLCVNDSQIIIDLASAESQKCFNEEMLLELIKCFKLDEMKNTPILLAMDKTVCPQLKEAGECTFKVADTCESKVPLQFFRNVYDIIMKELPCSDEPLNKTTEINFFQGK